MSKAILKMVSDGMETIGIEYGFVEYSGNNNGKVVYPYFVGEYTEAEPMTEDGMHEFTFMLTGFSRDSWLTLENAKEAIEEYFNKTAITDSGSGVAVSYAGSLIVPTGDAELKKIQINLNFKEWKVK